MTGKTVTIIIVIIIISNSSLLTKERSEDKTNQPTITTVKCRQATRGYANTGGRREVFVIQKGLKMLFRQMEGI